MKDFSQSIIGIVYDFDKTLSPKDMQEYGVFGHIEMSASEFWDEVHKERDRSGAEELLVYMRKMIRAAEARQNEFTREKFRSHGESIKFFPGVETWFDRINEHVKRVCPGEGIKIEHYVVSSGLADMILGSGIAKHFERVYACEFIYEEDRPVWPARVVTDAAKTQYIFRINKGLLDPNDKRINQHMSERDRRAPFSNLIYIGDSDTDIPSMNVVMKNGGHSIAVYASDKSNDKSHQRKMADLKKAGRIDFFCQADYREGSTLETLMLNTLEVISKRIQLRRRIYDLPPRGPIA